jgi:hypothetical protein
VQNSWRSDLDNGQEIEADVYVLQTALGLRGQSCNVGYVTDAIGSARHYGRDRSMERHGRFEFDLLSAEMLIFS